MKDLGEFLLDVFLDEPRDRVRRIIRDLADRDRGDAVGLAGTELRRLIRSTEIAGLPFVDTTAIHLGAIVQRLSGVVHESAA